MRRIALHAPVIEEGEADVVVHVGLRKGQSAPQHLRQEIAQREPRRVNEERRRIGAAHHAPAELQACDACTLVNARAAAAVTAAARTRVWAWTARLP